MSDSLSTGRSRRMPYSTKLSRLAPAEGVGSDQRFEPARQARQVLARRRLVPAARPEPDLEALALRAGAGRRVVVAHVLLVRAGAQRALEVGVQPALGRRVLVVG